MCGVDVELGGARADVEPFRWVGEKRGVESSGVGLVGLG